jgi:c-di-GMP-related signal transduction protein
MDPIHAVVDLFQGFFFSKIIPKILENPRTSYFCKNTLELFQNYILLTAILHLGPYLIFYNYN